MRKLVKSAAAWSAGAALALASFAGATLPANADGAATCTTSLKTYSTVKAGMAGARPNAAECLLADAGFAASPDAAFGDDDATAAKAFQESIGLPSTGVVDRGTWTALLSRGSTPTLKSGSKGPDVERLQTALRAAGYSKVTSSGIFGTTTKAAVKGVQKSQKWRQTGTATAGVWTALQSGAKVTVTSKAKKKAKKKASSTSKGRKALAFAKRQLGDSYRYGAEGPNAWDCSGLTKKAWAAAGVKLPHSARGQYSKGKRISKSKLRKGDLVFFYSGISHVAIYAGNGKVIHASRPGAPVSYIKMKYMPYVGAVRPG